MLPSYREGFPLVVQEALASGLPVILSDDEGYGPYRGLPGLSFCPLDPAAIRRAILAGLGSGRPGPGGDGSNALDELAPSFGQWIRRLYGDRVAGSAPASNTGLKVLPSLIIPT